MTHVLGTSFLQICNEVLSENKSLDEWAEIESDDMFQSDNYLGGFDTTEMEFCFCVFILDDEYWFQMPLDSIKKVVEREIMK